MGSIPLSSTGMPHAPRDYLSPLPAQGLQSLGAAIVAHVVRYAGVRGKPRQKWP
jgi:hypothetical protein